MKAIIALLIWLSLVTVGSLMPAESIEVEEFIDYDKFIHFIFYLGTSFLFFNVLQRKTLKNVLLAVSLSSIYGYFMEIMQRHLDVGRNFDYYDIIANIIGALIGALIYLKFKN